MLQRCIDDAALPVRPDLQLDWPSGEAIPAEVAAAVTDALATSLTQIARHRGVTSAFVSIAWRRDAIEVCVVDDGRAPGAIAPRASRREGHLDEANGVAHDVDDYGVVGICQWWSIPLDLS